MTAGVFQPTEATKRWQARVDAARKAVSDAEQAMARETVPSQQTFHFRELRQRERELQEALRAKC